MSNLYALIIVRNGQETLARCLDSVKEKTDGVVALMVGESTDQTEEILQQYKAVYSKVPWEDNFAKARNQLFDYARAQGVVWGLLVDADDVLKGYPKSHLCSLEKVNAVGAMLGIEHSGLSYLQRRIFRLGASGEWRGRVHETYSCEGSFPVIEDVSISHVRGPRSSASAGGRNLSIFERWFREAPEEFDGHNYYNYGNELYWHGRWVDAARVYDLAVSKTGWDDEKYFGRLRRADCFMNLGAYPQAWEEIILAMQLKPDWKDSYLWALRWFYFRKLWMMVIYMNLFAATRKVPDTPLPVAARFYDSDQAVYVGFALARMYRTQEALKVVREGLRFDPTNAMLIKNEKIYADYIAKGGKDASKKETTT